ncbi:hypothetical protein B0H14DRAFT_2709702 [Mycena olivaceomarginata]|nr:hypothetical protein B0H14DRAFT_2709702 [Mycena olivaceomarginata]
MEGGAPPLPPDVSSWYVATGSSLMLPHSLFSWWEATGGPFFLRESASTTESSSTSTSTNITSISISLSTVPSDAASSTPTPSSNPINAVVQQENRTHHRRRSRPPRSHLHRCCGLHYLQSDASERAIGASGSARTTLSQMPFAGSVDTPAPGPPAWRPPYNDVKAPLEGDTAPLFEKSGDPSLPGPLEHTGGEFHSGPPSSLV